MVSVIWLCPRVSMTVRGEAAVSSMNVAQAWRRSCSRTQTRSVAAARREAALSVGSEAAFADLPAAGSVPEREPTTAEVGA